MFDVDEASEYVQTLVARCLDKYFESRVKQAEPGTSVEIDPRLTSIVERMIERCVALMCCLLADAGPSPSHAQRTMAHACVCMHASRTIVVRVHAHAHCLCTHITCARTRLLLAERSGRYLLTGVRARGMQTVTGWPMLPAAGCVGAASVAMPVIHPTAFPAALFACVCARAHARCRCVVAGQYEQAIGVTLEGRRLDKLEEVVARVAQGSDRTRVLKYALRVCQQLVVSRAFRQQVRGAPGRGGGGER